MTKTELLKIRQEANQAFGACSDQDSGSSAQQSPARAAIDSDSCRMYQRGWERLRARLLGSGGIFTVPIQAVKESLGIKDKEKDRKVEARPEVKETSGTPGDIPKTPPLSVVVPPAKSSTIVIKKEGGTETYTFSPDVSDDVKKAVLEKDKPKVVTVKKDEATTTVPAK